MRTTSDHGSRQRSLRALGLSRPVARGRAGTARRTGERGSSLVELALILPMFLMLVFGMITGGIAWDRNQSLMHAAREGTRYGATLPVTGGEVEQWLDEVAAVAISNADGNLDPSISSRYLCVALVGGPGGDTRRVVDGPGGASYETGTCFDDDSDGTRVQAVARRTSDLSAVLFNRTLTLSRSASAQFEATP